MATRSAFWRFTDTVKNCKDTMKDRERGNDLVPVCSAAEVAEGTVRQYEVAGLGTIALYCIEGAHYATDDLCTHGQASLSDEGSLDGHIIYCGWHLGSFDVRTGEPASPPCTQPLQTYRVEIIAGVIHVAKTAR